jgi:electron transfer flavoprotein alpha subunit
MESILVLTHCDETGATLSKGSLEAVTAAHELAARLGASLTIGILGSGAQYAARSVASAGARVLSVAGEAFAQSRFASDAAACTAICGTSPATIVLAPHSSRFARVMAAVAHRIGGNIDTHIAAIGGTTGIEASRWLYRQRIEAVLTRASRPWFLLLDAGTHKPWSCKDAPIDTEQLAVELPALRTKVVGARSPEQGAAGTIRPEAKLLFVAGAGWTKKQPDGRSRVVEAGDLILRFLHNAGASLGSSKSLVDQGGEGNAVLPFLTHLNQVGQTGSTPRHPKGLATCCHGEEPHVVGWRFIGERRAVSLDPNCGWTRGKADVVYIADAFQVMARVNALLSEAAPD